MAYTRRLLIGLITSPAGLFHRSLRPATLSKQWAQSHLHHFPRSTTTPSFFSQGSLKRRSHPSSASTFPYYSTSTALFQAKMGTSSKKKVYAVAVGRKTGIFDTWDECNAQVKGFSGAKYKSFPKKEEAQAFIDQNSASSSQPAKNGSKKRRADDKDESPLEDTNGRKRRRHLPTPTKIVHVKIHVMFDGGSRGNPGKAGAGAIVTSMETPLQSIIKSETAGTPPKPEVATKEWQNRYVTKIRDYLGDSGTNNQAEYQGLCTGLKQAIDDLHRVVQSYDSSSSDDHVIHFDVECIVEGDSELIIRQITGEYKCNDKLKPFLKRAKRYEEMMKTMLTTNENRQGSVDIVFQHVERARNSIADGLANEAMSARRSWSTVTVDGEELNERNDA